MLSITDERHERTRDARRWPDGWPECVCGGKTIAKKQEREQGVFPLDHLKTILFYKKREFWYFWSKPPTIMKIKAWIIMHQRKRGENTSDCLWASQIESSISVEDINVFVVLEKFLQPHLKFSTDCKVAPKGIFRYSVFFYLRSHIYI